MRSHNNLYDNVCSFENLLRAARRARRGKRLKPSVGRFEVELEKEVHRLRNELLSQTYTPGRYRAFMIREPKRRLISAAPYRDRVVHHALCNVVGPLFERRFIFDSYANRVGKGTHRAIERFQHFARRYAFVLKCDVAKYFPSIDHDILKQIIRRTIRCRRTLRLVDLIIDRSNAQDQVLDYFTGDDLFAPLRRRKGLPIGNLTSQLFGNVYLDPLDHFIKDELSVRGYVRYVDDFVVFGDNRQKLWEMREICAGFLARLRVTLNEKKSLVHSTRIGVDFLGHRLFPFHRRLRRSNVVRFRRRLKRLLLEETRGAIALGDLSRRVEAWEAHALFSNTYRLRQAVLRQYHAWMTAQVQR